MIEILNNNDCIEVVSISDIYIRDTEDDDNLILSKSNVRIKQTIFKYDIEHVREVVSDKGIVKNNRVELGIRSKEPITILGNYKEFKKIITEVHKPIVGFKFYAKQTNNNI